MHNVIKHNVNVVLKHVEIIDMEKKEEFMKKLQHHVIMH